MTPIDYLLLAGALLAGGYVVARLFVGYLRSSGNPAAVERDNGLNPHPLPERELERVAKPARPGVFANENATDRHEEASHHHDRGGSR